MINYTIPLAGAYAVSSTGEHVLIQPDGTVVKYDTGTDAFVLQAGVTDPIGVYIDADAWYVWSDGSVRYMSNLVHETGSLNDSGGGWSTFGPMTGVIQVISYAGFASYDKPLVTVGYALRSDGRLYRTTTESEADWGGPFGYVTGAQLASNTSALDANGTTRVWGNTGCPARLPEAALTSTTIATLAIGGDGIFDSSVFAVALHTDGTVTAWGEDDFGQATVPALGACTAVSCGKHHALALQADQTVVAWGRDFEGQATVPPGLAPVAKIYAESSISVVVHTDGTVTAWGEAGDARRTIPGGLTGVANLALGAAHVVALHTDGTVSAWGDNTSGQTTVPGGLTSVAKVTAGATHSVALKSDGTVSAWGDNTSGQTNVTTWAGMTDIAPATNLTMGLSASGVLSTHSDAMPLEAELTGRIASIHGRHDELYPWATTSDGMAIQLYSDDGAFGDKGAPHLGLPIPIIPFDAYLAPEYTGPAITSPAVVNRYGIIGVRNGAVVAHSGPFDLSRTPPSVVSTITQLRVSTDNGLALRADGTILAWGAARQGAWDTPPGLQNVVAIDTGFYQSVALLEDGTVVTWGDASTVPLSDGRMYGVMATHSGIVCVDGRSRLHWYPKPNFTPRAPTISTQPSYRTIACGSDFIAGVVGVAQLAGFAITGTAELAPPEVPAQGDVTQVLGQRYSRMLRTGTQRYFYMPAGSTATWEGASGNADVAVGIGFYIRCLPKRASDAAYSGRIYVEGITGAQVNTLPAPPNGYKNVAAGAAHGLALNFTGTVVGWGNNTYGQTTIPSTGTVDRIGAAWYASYAVSTLNVLYVWGDIAAPPGSATSNVSACALGYQFGVSLKLDGTVIAWGDNTYGQATVPGGLTTIQAVAAGDYHALALKADGSVVAWGRNDTGESTVPIGLTSVVSIAAGNGWSEAVKADGTTVSWGDTSYAFDPYPLATVADLHASGQTTLARNTDGTVAIWGLGIGALYKGLNASQGSIVDVATHHDGTNQYALFALTDGSVVMSGTSTFTATIPPGLTNVRQVAAGATHALAVHADGSVTAWGDNDLGQSTVPPGTNAALGVATGTKHTLALAHDGVVTAWGDNTAGQTTVPGMAVPAIQVAAADNTSFAVLSDGTVATWGSAVLAPPAPALASVIRIIASSDICVALHADGSLTMWGTAGTVPTSVPNVDVQDHPRIRYFDALSFMQAPGIAVQGTASASGGNMNYNITFTDSLGLADTSVAQFVKAYIERLGLADNTSNLIDALEVITEGIGFRGAVHYVWQFLFSEGLAFADDLAASRAYMVELADALALHAGGSSQLDAQAVVVEALGLGALHGFVLPFTFSEGLGLGDTQGTQLAALHKAMDTLALADTQAMHMSMTMLVEEGLALDDTSRHTAALQFAFAEDIGFMVRVHLDDGLYVAWVFHAESRAFTEYRNYPFNSFCRMPDNTYYGAMADGIYRLDGDDDAGTSIEARIRGGLEQFGTARAKRLPEMFLGYRASGDMVLKVIVTSETGAKQEHWYKVIPRAAGATRESRVKIGRGLKSVYYGWELANVDGADFALDEIAFHPMILERRIT
ncbi:MAG: hypothetical protein L0H83_01350 [Salinisphaera sp.]|nr:hypothetical protein [Salinisphaera sp.]